jgi:hypothetical protein
MFGFAAVLVGAGLLVTWLGAALGPKARPSPEEAFDARDTPLTARSMVAFALKGVGIACFLTGIVIMFLAVGLALAGE